MSWPVEVFTHQERGLTPPSGIDRSTLTFHCFWLMDPEPQYFLWGCPRCGGLWSGWLAGPKERPQGHSAEWSFHGTIERPTLSPSLVCAGVRLGTCTGHFWLRDGQLADVG